MRMLTDPFDHENAVIAACRGRLHDLVRKMPLAV